MEDMKSAFCTGIDSYSDSIGYVKRPPASCVKNGCDKVVLAAMQDSKTPCRMQTGSDMDLCEHQVDQGKCGYYKDDIGMICEMPDSTLNVYYTAAVGEADASSNCQHNKQCNGENICCGGGCAPSMPSCVGRQCGFP